MGTRAWYHYRKSVKGQNLLADFTTAVVNLEALAFFNEGTLSDSDFIRDVPISAVAVWDTVGAMGIPEFDEARGGLIDAFRFADTQLSQKVTQGLHAIALDERRLLFTPTFWDRAQNVLQMVFPGAHADVGGGYSVQNNESGLSDGALLWTIDQLKKQGVLFSEAAQNIVPDATAPAHKEGKNLTTGKGVRRFNQQQGILEHPSVQLRKQALAVISAIGEPAAKYNPSNWPV